MSLRKYVFLVAVLGGVSVLVLTSLAATTESQENRPSARVIPVDPTATEYVRLLGGPPETVTMHAGLVVLEPGESVGIHNTENYEEVLVVLEGVGKMVITDGPELTLQTSTMAYCPPRTEHNVTNTGSGALRYIYVVSNAEE